MNSILSEVFRNLHLMKHKIFSAGFLVTVCVAQSLYSQDTTARRFAFDGYLSFTESVMDLNVPVRTNTGKACFTTG